MINLSKYYWLIKVINIYGIFVKYKVFGCLSDLFVEKVFYYNGSVVEYVFNDKVVNCMLKFEYYFDFLMIKKEIISFSNDNYMLEMMNEYDKFGNKIKVLIIGVFGKSGMLF